MSKIKTLVVDDSALMRQLISQVLSSDPDIEVVGTASDPYKAREKILALNPDVLTLDVEMPRMDGLTFLGKLMRSRPMPVVMVSSLTERGCDTTLKALEYGAVDFVTKPRIDVTDGIAELGTEIIGKVKHAAKAKVRRIDAPVQVINGGEQSNDALITSTHKVIAIGTSTGGTQALTRIIPALPANTPGIVVVIHMPAGFTGRYAKRLNEMSQMTVKEAENLDVVLPGHVLIAPGNHHMEIKRSGARYKVKINDNPPVNQFRPSVDVLFKSCAQYVGTNCIGAILTGMGNDGAEGLMAMREAGAHTIAQDEKSCVVYGMPREAVERGAAAEILTLDDIAPAILEKAKTMVAEVTR